MPAEEGEVRKEVLARIDLLKELSPKERDYLYAQVDRARGFTKLAIIPFPSGKTRPEQFQIDPSPKLLAEARVSEALRRSDRCFCGRWLRG